ncbi:MAG: hypothetical protein IPM13_08180 [Phycisphaerales bacterium]|nr:hypothetical protein [Phycisphaerales bacterium]
MTRIIACFALVLLGGAAGLLAQEAGAPSPPLTSDTLALTAGDQRIPPDALAPHEHEDDLRAAALGTAFTYQGRLSDGGVPANGQYDLRFTLTDELGGVVAGPICLDNVVCTDGLFTVTLDFGPAFDTEQRELAIAVRPGGLPGDCAAGGPFTLLSPRQRLQAAPFALGLRLPYRASTVAPGTAVEVTNLATELQTAAIRGVRGGSISSAFADRAGVRGDGQGIFDAGVLGISSSYIGVVGFATAANSTGVLGRNDSQNGIGVRGWALGSDGIGVRGQGPSDGWSGYFTGRAYFGGPVGIGVATPTNELEVVGKTQTTTLQVTSGAAAGRVLTSDGAGNATWQPVPVPATPTAFVSGFGADPTGTLQFLSATATVTITAGQKIFVSASKAFGSTTAGGASTLNLFIGYRLNGGSTVTTVGGGILGNRVPQNTRIPMSLSGVITALPAGTYQVGLVGACDASQVANWNSNEWSYVSAIVLD